MADDGDSAWIAAKRRNVVLRPVQCGDDIQQPEIAARRAG
jgi:hypothetical protein